MTEDHRWVLVRWYGLTETKRFSNSPTNWPAANFSTGTVFKDQKHRKLTPPIGVAQTESHQMQNPIRDTLAEGKVSLGSWLNLASAASAETMAAAGFTWLVVDAEHSEYDLGRIANVFRGIEARGAIPLARAWDHNPVTLSRILDAGAYGLVIPHVSTPQQAENLAQAMHYPPQGRRSGGAGRNLTLPDYFQDANDQVLCIPQIEDMQGIENAEAIAQVEGVDIGFLGPGDLAWSMGVTIGHPDHEAALRRFREGWARSGKPYGIPVDVAKVRQRIQEGYRFIGLASDYNLLLNAGRAAIEEATRG